MSRPQLVLIGGPNGAGKSTAAPQLLRDTLDVAEFVNADAIASGLSGFHPESAALQAGRVMLKRVRRLASNRADFAFESTLASRGFAPWINRLKQSGYVFRLAFLWLPNPDVAIARVAARVRAGGHDIPDSTIRRRYYSGLRNFFRLYRPIANDWRFYDSTATSGPRLISMGESTADIEVRDVNLWTRIKEGVQDCEKVIQKRHR
jgi:predicted ABC-type ATPase